MNKPDSKDYLPTENMSRFDLINAGWEPPRDAAKLKKEIRRLKNLLKSKKGVDVGGLKKRVKPLSNIRVATPCELMRHNNNTEWNKCID